MPTHGEELEPLLRLGLVEGVGPRRLHDLIERFGSAERVLAAPPSVVQKTSGVGSAIAARIAAAAGRGARERTRNNLRLLHRIGATVTSRRDPQYPTDFLRLAEPPYLLFSVGDLGLLERPAVAIVGTRRPSAYGRQAASNLARDLGLAGVTVVSGMARGIDSAAHRGALTAAAGTIGVLGHGIDQVYPRDGRRLFEEVGRSGLLLTEFMPGETPKAGNFPRRNRLIAALSRAVIVVEMGHRSGAQHTVGYALEQGLEVMAVPGPISDAASEGSNQLIRDGARLVTCAEDVLDEIFGVAPRRLAEAEKPPPPAIEPESAGGRRILGELSSAPVHVDVVAAAIGMEAGKVLSAMVELEVMGLVESAPGMRFRKAGANPARRARDPGDSTLGR